ncbi:MAG: nucleoside triphosphate pyrophosphatase [Alphaproteobacteria bacterium]
MTLSETAAGAIGGNGERLILASGSVTRRRLLDAAGVPFDVEPANVDEDEFKLGLRAEGAAGIEIAEVLAEAKAMYVSRKHAGRMVLGADQILECDGETLDKPVDRADAFGQLRMLSGRRHELISYAVIVRDGRRIWQGVDRARLEMRETSDEFLEAYLDAVGNDVYNGPGGYRVEALGVQLFRRIDGSHYTILGLPFLALLDYLRDNGILMS